MAPRSDRFAKFDLVERLAIGGMAEVYLGVAPEQIAPERLVAVKRILPNVSENREFVQMFLDEAKITGHLHHPNIGQIYDVGDHNGTFYIAMEYISGHDLRVIWERERATGGGGLPIPIAVSIVQKICAGLDYAHRKTGSRGESLSIIHRDVSPQNILMSYDGELKVIDFGIAKAANRTVRTQTGILKGKFAYMSPEQALGKELDRRSDIFAIGVILHELLTGTRTFKGANDIELIEKVRKAEFVPPSELNPSVPKALERIVYKALAEKPDDRYHWASEMETALDAFAVEYDQIATKNDLRTYIRQRFPEEVLEEQTRLKDYALLFNPGQDFALSTSSQARFLSEEIGHMPGDEQSPPASHQASGTVVDNSFEGSDVETDAFNSGDMATQIRGMGDESEELEQTRSGFSKPKAIHRPKSDVTSTEELKAKLRQSNRASLPSMNTKYAIAVVGILLVAGVVAMLMRDRGWLIATSAPGYTIQKGGELLCESTPCRISPQELPSTIDLVLNGRIVHSETLLEEPNEVLVIDIQAKAGEVTIQTEPEGAQVFLNDKLVSDTTPAQLSDIIADETYTLRAEKKGYALYEKAWRAPQAGKESEVNIKLNSLEGDSTRWRVEAEPGDAIIYTTDETLSALKDVLVVNKNEPRGAMIARPGCNRMMHTFKATAEPKEKLKIDLKCQPFDSALNIRANGSVHIWIDGIPLAGEWRSIEYWLPAGEHLVELYGENTQSRHVVTTSKKRKTRIRSKAK